MERAGARTVLSEFADEEARLERHPSLLQTMSEFDAALQILLSGLLQGWIYVLLSIGLTIIFGVMGIINFAQAEFTMLGMFFSFFLFSLFGVNPIVAVFLSIPLFFLFGAIIQRSFIDPILDEQEEAQFIVTFGLLLLLQNAAEFLWGSSPRIMDIGYAVQAIHLGPIQMSEARFIASLFAMGLTVVAVLVVKYTEFGRAMRATADTPDLAEYSGIDTHRINLITFGLGAALTAAGGVLVAMYFPVSSDVGLHFIIIMFVVVVLGGIGSIKGAVIAGLAIGVLESMSTFWLPLQLQPAVAFTLFLAVILVRPEGLYGTRVREV